MQSNFRPVRGIFTLALIAIALLLVGAIGISGAASRSCGSFKSQAEAQGYFLEEGGSIERGVGKLDPDHNGVACEGLSGPYAGFATLGYNKKRDFFYGTASMPPRSEGGAFPCMLGDRHFPDSPRKLNVYKIDASGDKALFSGKAVAALAEPEIGRLIWKADKKTVVSGRYFVEFEARVRMSPYGANECPAFRSPVVRLP